MALFGNSQRLRDLEASLASLRSENDNLRQQVARLEADHQNAQTQCQAAQAVARGWEKLLHNMERFGSSLANSQQTMALMANHLKAEKESAVTAGKITAGSQVQMHSISANLGLLAQQSQVTMGQVDGLNASTEKIGSILNLIKEIADQTNLLALNAAIEAARAGEAGRGFAVVADEVRKLAERTAQSTSEITGMIGSIQLRTEQAVDEIGQVSSMALNGVTLAEKAGVSVTSINGSVGEVSQIVADIARAAEEQHIASSSISGHIEDISRQAFENTSAIRDVAKAAHTLEKMADDMRTTIARFRV